MNFTRNNLDTATSPYLRQHKDNPVHWQEWSQEVLEHALRTHKPLFVSVGYSTCHWCHVMAGEAFSDAEVAAYLNEHFISIKVDREERPDIDQFLMHFLVSISGQGGWPLNGFLTPQLNPVYAFTYLPPKGSDGRPGFLDVATKVLDFYRSSAKSLTPFKFEIPAPVTSPGARILKDAQAAFDGRHGGFGSGQKFPSHCTLLYLLYQPDADSAAPMLEKTLDAMALRGLHDHLQGGIYRYCTDAAWTIPHFEKMLYDQALAMWVYSLAYRVLGKESYRRMVVKIGQCLEETFEDNGLFISAHDADTNHHEGATYLWSWTELESTLTPEEFSVFRSVYDISPEGNFENRNHLIRKNDDAIDEIEKKLLGIRRRRQQPEADRKVMTAWNALAGIGLVVASRYLNEPRYLDRAEKLASGLFQRHFDGTRLARWSLEGKKGGQAFLEDAAAFFLLLTFLNEDRPGWTDMMNVLHAYTGTFKTRDGWKESEEPDLFYVPGGQFDHPTPSSVAMAEWAILRAMISEKVEFEPGRYVQPLYYDFHNLSSLTRNGLFHIVTSPEPLRWTSLAPNTIQRRGGVSEDCYGGVCRKI